MTADFLLALAQAVAKGLLTGMVYGLMALGLSVIFGVMRVVNFAHGEMMVVGMYLAWLGFDYAQVSPLFSAEYNDAETSTDDAPVKLIVPEKSTTQPASGLNTGIHPAAAVVDGFKEMLVNVAAITTPKFILTVDAAKKRQMSSTNSKKCDITLTFIIH